MSNLNKRFRELDKVYVYLSKDIERKLAYSYRFTYDKIKDIITKLYNEFGDKPTITELRRYNRLANIENQIAQEINSLEKKLVKEIGKAREIALLTSRERTALTINEYFNLNFIPMMYKKEQLTKYLEDRIWIDALKLNSGKLNLDIKTQVELILRANAREEVIAGVMEGVPLRELSKTLQERFGVSLVRGNRIALTETHKFYNIGRNDCINESIEYLRKKKINAYKVWRHNNIGKPREDHLEADGQRADEEGFFYVGGEYLQAPGLGTDPANNINCHCSIDLVVEND